MPRPVPLCINGDRARIARHIARLMVVLNGRRWMPPMPEMARELGVCTRTVRRYLDAIEQAGWPLPKRWTEAA